MRAVWRFAALALCAVAGAAADAAVEAKTCFEFPIVTITPVDKPFPVKGCPQAKPPAENCLKANVEVDLEIVDNRAANGTALPNCVGDNVTDVYRSTAHYRGQSSLGFKKHQYSVKLHEAAPLLGFPEEKSFVLNGPHIDGSLIRNHMAHWLYRSTGRYSPKTRFAIVFLRNTATKVAHYQGVYLALEKISYGPNRVGLAPMTNQCNASQLSGGWAWQANPLNYGVYSPNVVVDQYQLMFGSGERPVLMYPKADDMTQTMRDYFVNTSTGPLPQMYRYLYDHMTEPEDMEKVVDIGSFVDYMLHSELSQNTDAYRRSAYFFKDRDQPINAGPVWDFNLAYGTGSNQPDWLHKSRLFWKRLRCNYKFASLAIQRWRQLRATVWSDETIETFIDESVAPFQRQFANCFHWYSAQMPCANVQVQGLYDANVDRVRQAIKSRAKWIDDNIGSFYMKIDKSVWAQATNLPTYNCAADGEDGGCLTNPDKYINNVTFPAVRKPYAGEACSSKPVEEASIDPCWMSAGMDPHFCSGNGYCPQGPGAKCTCIRGVAPTCTITDVPSSDDFATTTHTGVKPEEAAVGVKLWGNAAYLLVLVCGVLGALLVAQRRRFRDEATPEERQPINPRGQ